MKEKKGCKTLFGRNISYKDEILIFLKFLIETNVSSNATIDINHELREESLNEDEVENGCKVTITSINISKWKMILKCRKRGKTVD